ncbi:hypothetical protein AAC387_Pa06g0321 [Persea americana]
MPSSKPSDPLITIPMPPSLAFSLLEGRGDAKKLGILVISDEVYAHLTFGITHLCQWEFLDLWFLLSLLGPYRKDGRCPDGDLIVHGIKNFVNVSSDPATFIQPKTLMNEMQVKMNLSLLEDILDDMDYCCKVGKRGMGGSVVGWRNGLRSITFALEPSSLEEGILSEACKETIKACDLNLSLNGVVV